MTFQRVATSIPVPSPVMSRDDIPPTWLSLPKKRRDAAAKGLPWYFDPTRPCVHGHFSIRRIDRSSCPACEKRRFMRHPKSRND